MQMDPVPSRTYAQQFGPAETGNHRQFSMPSHEELPLHQLPQHAKTGDIPPERRSALLEGLLSCPPHAVFCPTLAQHASGEKVHRRFNAVVAALVKEVIHGNT